MIRHDERVLTAHEEVQLASRIQQGDRQAREQLVLANLRLVPLLAKRYVHKVTPLFTLEDLLQEGYLGLIKAVDKFDPSRGRFSTCAGWWIISTMSEALWRTRAIALPQYLLPVLRVLSDTEDTQREGKVAQMRAQFHLPQEVIVQLEYALQSLMRLDRPLSLDTDTTYGETLLDESTLETFEVIEKRELIEQLMRYLSPRTRHIICLVYGLDGKGGISLLDVARLLGISRGRVDQILKYALARMREWGPQDE